MVARAIALAAALSAPATATLAAADTDRTDARPFRPGHKVLRKLPRDLRRRLTGTRLLSDPPGGPQQQQQQLWQPGSGSSPPGGGLRVSPRQFGADPTGRTDSTDAVQRALAVCVDASRATPGTLPDGARDAGGCTVDLDGGEYLMSEPLLVPAYVSNMRVGWGSLVANAGNGSSVWAAPAAEPAAAAAALRRTAEGAEIFESGPMKDKFMIIVGGDVPCPHMQGSCNENVGFPGLFLDGSHVASGIQVNNVMGTTIGPQTYLLNFTGFGIQVNGGHEVMIDQTWLGETNFDFKFSKERPPKATAIDINSNDHYILDSIVFSALIGLHMGGAANVANGLHVWFPWNQAMEFGATAFLNTGSQNRYAGCYIDGSKAVFDNPNLVTWKNGFILGGAGIEISRDVRGLEVMGNEFVGGTVSFVGEPGAVVDAVITNNLFKNGGGRGSRASRSIFSADPTGMFQFDFCDDLVFHNITRVRTSFTTAPGGNGDIFPIAVARAPEGCRVRVNVRPESAGTVLVDVDTSDYVNFHAG